MALFLVQHGKCLPKDIDPNRSLSEEGISEAECIANTAKKHGVFVAQINHSGKKRARQTADIFASALKSEGGAQAIEGLNPLDDVSVIAKKIKGDSDLMLVGHLPFMERLTAYLITGTIESAVVKFQNSGIVCLDQDPGNQIWFIKWTLMPKIE